MIRPTSHADYFIATEKPSGYFHDSRYLYAFDDYLTLNRPPERTFFLINTRNKLIAGTSFFFQENKEWLSPFKAPFGGFDISDAPKEIIKEFVQWVIETLSSKPICIRLFPEAYDPGLSGLLHQILTDLGFEVSIEEPNHHVLVDEKPLEEKIHKMEQRKVNACLKNNFVFKKEDLSMTGQMYDYILECREKLNYTVSMSRNEIIDSVNQVPGHYHLFSVNDDAKRIAACISVAVNDEILYNFYPASLPDYKKYSPSVFMNCGIYKFCQNHGYKIMDLGTSFMEGKPNESLIAFKERLGASQSFRKSYKRA